MERQQPDHHLSDLTTHWTVFRNAHEGPEKVKRHARKELLQRYGSAVSAYLFGAVHDVDAAQELFQEFSLRFLQGAFHNANPEKGHFRQYLKTALFRLAQEYKQRRRKEPLPLLDGSSASPAAPEEAGLEQQFLEDWRDALLDHAWKALAKLEADTGTPYHIVLRLRADQPKLSSTEMAERLNSRLPRPLTDVGVRQLLHRAREEFSESLFQQVAQTLADPSLERVVEELADVGLARYCQSALRRRRSRY